MGQQLILAMIPGEATEINNQVCVIRGKDKWTYFLGTHPVYSHGATDQRMFRLVTSQLIDSGACRLVDVLRTFGEPKSNVIRSLGKLRSEGPEGFFKVRPGRHGGRVFTKEILEDAQRLLDQGRSRRETADELSVPYDTLRKAINDSRLREPDRQACQEASATTKSSRDVIDAKAAEGRRKAFRAVHSSDSHQRDTQGDALIGTHREIHGARTAAGDEDVDQG